MHATAAAYRRRENTAYAALLSLAAIDAAGYSVIAPTFPHIADQTGAGPAAVGALVASFPAAMVVGFVLAGRAVRHGQRSAVIAISLALSALGCVGFIVGDTLAVFLPARAIMGLGSGGLWIAVTFATLEWWPGQEYLCLSRIFAAYSVGGLLGPALGALEGVRAPFTAYLGLLLLGLAVLSPVGRPPAVAASRATGRRSACPGSGWRAPGSCSRALPSASSRASSRCTSRKASPRRRSARSTSPSR